MRLVLLVSWFSAQGGREVEEMNVSIMLMCDDSATVGSGGRR